MSGREGSAWYQYAADEISLAIVLNAKRADVLKGIASWMNHR